MATETPKQHTILGENPGVGRAKLLLAFEGEPKVIGQWFAEARSMARDYLELFEQYAALEMRRVTVNGVDVTQHVSDLVDENQRLIERLESLQESYRALHRQWNDVSDERDRLRVMLDAVLPEKTTFHVIEGDMPGHHIPIQPKEWEASSPASRSDA